MKGKRFVKMSIYPLQGDTVVKLIIEGKAITQAVVDSISRFSNQMDIIHTSGFTVTKDRMVYEMYVVKTKSSQQFEEIQEK